MARGKTAARIRAIDAQYNRDMATAQRRKESAARRLLVDAARDVILARVALDNARTVFGNLYQNTRSVYIPHTGAMFDDFIDGVANTIMAEADTARNVKRRMADTAPANDTPCGDDSSVTVSAEDRPYKRRKAAW